MLNARASPPCIFSRILAFDVPSALVAFQCLKEMCNTSGCFRWEVCSAVSLSAVTRNRNYFVCKIFCNICKNYFICKTNVYFRTTIFSTSENNWHFLDILNEEYVVETAQFSGDDLGSSLLTLILSLVDLIHSTSFNHNFYSDESQIFTCKEIISPEV